MLAFLGRWAPLVVVGVAVLGGFVLESVVLPAFYGRAKERGSALWSVVLDAIRGVVILWSAAAGIFIALLLFPLRGEEELVATRSLAILLIWSVTVVAARAGVQLVQKYNASGKHVPKTASLFTTLTSIAVYAVGILIVLQYLGISIAPILAAFGVGGLAVALALRDTLANFFSGLQIILSDRLRVGDFIRLENGGEGFVTDITWLHTTIRDPVNSLVVVPNEKIASAAFTNFSLPNEQTLVSATVNLAYGNDLERSEAIALEVADSMKDDFASNAPPPVARILAAKDTGLEFAVFFHVRRYGNQIRVRHEFYKRLFARYAQERIALSHVPWAAADVPEEKPSR